MLRYLALLFLVSFSSAKNITDQIIANARADGIDIYCLDFAATALASIEAIADSAVEIEIPAAVANSSTIDVHGHAVPAWYRALTPLTGGFPTPNWTIESHLDFMANNSIGHAVLSISSPGSVVYPGDETKSAALARLLNEYLAAIARRLPTQFSFFAVTPLPYTQAAIIEAHYALNHLDAAGIGLLTNHEAYYLGNPMFEPFFAAVNQSSKSKHIVFVHPTSPCLHAANGSLISADPTIYPPGLAEFYYENARSIMDLTLSQTIINFTSIDWIMPQAGGSWPSVEDRVLTSYPTLIAASKQAYSTRMWWDAAGPVYPHQIQGLLAYGVPPSQLVYGSDYPYAPPFAAAPEIQAIENATFLTSEEKTGVFYGNARSLLGGLTHF